MKNKIHIQRLKLIRPYINFNYSINEIKKGNLSNYDKAKIKKYYDIVNGLQSQPHYVYRGRNNSRLKAAMEFANQPKLKGFKAALIPTPEFGRKPKISFNKKGDITVSNSKHIHTKSVLFNKRDLLINPEKEIKRALNKFPATYKRFAAMCDVHEQRRAYSKNKTVSEITKLMMQYRNEEKNNYFGNWLNGLYGYSFDNQTDYDEYKSEKRKAKTKLQKDRKNAKRRAKRKK